MHEIKSQAALITVWAVDSCPKFLSADNAATRFRLHLFCTHVILHADVHYNTRACCAWRQWSKLLSKVCVVVFGCFITQTANNTARQKTVFDFYFWHSSITVGVVVVRWTHTVFGEMWTHWVVLYYCEVNESENTLLKFKGVQLRANGSYCKKIHRAKILQTEKKLKAKK